MGALIYDGERFEFEDRALSHLQAVVTMKLRRREPFLLTWSPGDGGPIVRRSVWIDNAIPLRYEFDTAAPERLDDQWLNLLADHASRAGGLVFTPETAEPATTMSRPVLLQSRPAAANSAGLSSQS